jgi:hypothetical protein
MHIMLNKTRFLGRRIPFLGLPTICTRSEIVFDIWFEMGNFPLEIGLGGLFQSAGLAYFSDLQLSVKRSRGLEWGLECHE